MTVSVLPPRCSPFNWDDAGQRSRGDLQAEHSYHERSAGCRMLFERDDGGFSCLIVAFGLDVFDPGWI
jgi:hypothetical protein